MSRTLAGRATSSKHEMAPGFGLTVAVLTVVVALLSSVGLLVSSQAAVAAPAKTPSNPSSVVAVARSAAAALSWKAPSSTGNRPITGYYVTPHRGSVIGSTRWFAGTATKRRVTGLMDGAGYQFTVVAANASGSGPASGWSNYVTPSTVPGTPTEAASSARGGEASVVWIVPRPTLYPITSYLITPYARGKRLAATRVGPTVNAALVVGLQDGTSYRFTVTAVNAIGRSRSSNLTNASVPTANRTTFYDSFDSNFGTGPNAGLAKPVWRLDGCWTSGCGNHSDAEYLRSNIYQDGKGALVLRATSRATRAMCGSRRCDYTGAGIHMYTANGNASWSQQYGTFSARIKLPTGAGLWPAFWLAGSNLNRVGWPSCGEIDALEADGGSPSLVQQHIHYGMTNHQLGSAWRLPDRESTAGWHTYSVTWSPSGIVWSVDGRPTMSVLASTVGPAIWHTFFAHPFTVVLDLTVDGTYVSPPTPSTHFPADMYVDYVKVTRS
jgi:beta-glucanase (GH16 family)